MGEIESLLKKAATIIEQSNDPEAIEKGAQLLRLAAETEKQRVETQKLRVEEEKLKVEIKDSRRNYITHITPWVSTLVLAGGLVMQGYKLRSAQQEQDNAREDAHWAEVQKSTSESMSEGKRTITEAVELGQFLQSPRYHDTARTMSDDFLRLTDGIDEKGDQAFKTLFSALYPHLNWQNLDQALDLDRDLTKAWNEKNAKDQKDPRLPLIIDELSFIGSHVAELLRQHRPAGIGLDLHSVSVFGDDFSKANLRGANLEGFVPGRVVLDHADLSEVPEPRNGYWNDSFWWHADSISPGLLKYLCANAPFNPSPAGHYGLTLNPTETEDERQLQTKKCGQ
jgi:Pentapeptide repeats (8 copies)